MFQLFQVSVLNKGLQLCLQQFPQGIHFIRYAAATVTDIGNIRNLFQRVEIKVLICKYINEIIVGMIVPIMEFKLRIIA